MKKAGLIVFMFLIGIFMMSFVYSEAPPTEVWNKMYDSGIANGIAVDTSGNVYVTGISNNNYYNNYYTIKYNSAGDVLWSKSYDSGDYDGANGIAVDTSGNVYVTGEKTGSYHTIKYNSAGDVLWSKDYDGGGNDAAYGIAVDTSGNVYVTGRAKATQDYHTIKYDSSGNVLWSQDYDSGGNNDAAYGIAVDTSGNVYVTGEKTGSYHTIKYNSAGNVLWSKDYDSGNIDVANGIAVDTSGNVYVTGYHNYKYSTIAPDYYTIKYNSAGDVLWSKSYDAIGQFDIAKSIAVDTSGNVYVTGANNNGNNYYTIKYNSAGDVLWSKSYDGGGNDGANGIAVDTSGNVYVTGYITYISDSTRVNYYTIKYAQSEKTCLESQTILKLSSATNSHGAIYSDTAYTYDICYTDIFTEGYNAGTTNPHTCTANNANKILYLSANSNAHASTTSSIDYTTQICFGDLICSVKPTCDDLLGEKTLLSLSSTTNAHISAGNDNNYPTKICCSKATTTCTPDCAEKECGDDGCGGSCGICMLESCVLNKCTNTKTSYWAEIDTPLESISTKGVIPDTTKVLLNVANAEVYLSEEYSFKIYYNEINEANLIKTINGIVTNIPEGNMFSVEWLISLSEITNKDLTKPFKFIVNIGGTDITSNDLKLNLLEECFFGTTQIIMCADYKTDTKCNADLCKIADYSINLNNPEITCGQGYDCFCGWDTTDGKCKPGNIKDPITPPVGFDDSWLGTCNYNEDINDDCTDDFLEYKWAGIWTKGTGQTSDPGNSDFELVDGKWYYNPLTDGVQESVRCALSSGAKTVPCPTSVKLPFFGFWNFIFAGLFIIGIYLRLLRKKKN